MILFSPDLELCKENGNLRVGRDGTTRSLFFRLIN
jgi:hypothetical protein